MVCKILLKTIWGFNFFKFELVIILKLLVFSPVLTAEVVGPKITKPFFFIHEAI